MAHYLVRTSEVLQLEKAKELFSRRTRRAGLPIAATVTKKSAGLGAFSAPHPRILKLEVASKAALPESLNIEAVEGLRRLGIFSLQVPLHFEGHKRGEDSQCDLMTSPQRWHLLFSIDTDAVGEPQHRRVIFEELLGLEGWTAKIEEERSGGFVLRRDGSGCRVSSYGQGKRNVDPFELTLEGKDEWEQGLAPFFAASRKFGAGSKAWSWGFEISVAIPPTADAEPASLWKNLQELGLPFEDVSLTFDLHLASIDELEELRQSLGPQDRAVADLVSLEMSPGYTADIDLISTEAGHTLEADLKGGWGHEERTAFEDLLGVPLVDA